MEIAKRLGIARASVYRVLADTDCVIVQRVANYREAPFGLDKRVSRAPRGASSSHIGGSMSLKAGQQKALREFEQIASAIGMDHWNIEEYADAARVPMLMLMKNRLVRGEIVLKYALIDEYLTVIICNYYFRRKVRDRSFLELWKTKKFQVFNHEIMDQLYVLQKMRVVQAIGDIPKEVRASIGRINDVRNDIAHSFFPENRKVHIPARKRLYEGEDIFSLGGVEKFEHDFAVARDYLEKRAFGVTQGEDE